MADIIQIRRDTSSNWTSANPTLAQGELGIETNTSKIKVGDGSTAWTSLGYLINTGGYALTSGNLSQFAATTSAQLLGVLSDETGTGAAVFATSPTLVTPALGTPASGVATNLSGTAANLTAGTVTTNANLTGHITSTGNAAVLGSFTSAQLATALSDETGSGAAVFATSPTLVTPALGTPASGTLTNATGLPIGSGVSGLASGVATFLGTSSSANLASAVTDETGSGALVFGTSPTLVTPALGTPASGVMTNATGLPLATGVTGTLPFANGGSGAITPLVKSANYTAVNRDYVIVTAGSITITLPASPSAGDTVTIKDGTGAAATTSFTVGRNSSKIASSATDLTFDKNFAEIVMTYINSTIGWSV